MHDHSKRSVDRHLPSRLIRSFGRYRRALILRAMYGAAGATGTGAVTLIVLVIQKKI